MFHSPNKIILYCAYKLTVEHIRSISETVTINGTAFYIKKDYKFFLITNRHNLDPVMKDPKYEGFRPRSITISGYFAGKHLVAESVTSPTVIGYPANLDEDVAAIDVTSFEFSLNKQASMEAAYLDYTALADEGRLGELNICDMVALPGYPDFFDRNGDRPIIRMGTIASDPESNYCDKGMEPARRIAYEAFSSAGSSGSPVFALAKGLKLGAGLSGGYFREMTLIGVNAGHLRGRDEMNSQHAGISYCFKSSCIIDAINAASKPT